ncbi:MAG: site-2 protease family protein [Planctomycetota bacterium]
MDPDTFKLIKMGLFLAVLIFSVVTHEFFHGWTADRMGDDTARLLGRLTFNPLAHIDPFMTIMLPILTLMSFGFPFGGAKPVPVNPLKLTRKGEFLVSIAGPGSNLALGAAAFLLLLVLHPIVPRGSLGYWLLYAAFFLNVLLAVFNMIPIPPLDGSHVLTYFIPALKEPFRRLGFAGMFIVLLVLVMGGFGLVIGPIFDAMEITIFWIYGVA